MPSLQVEEAVARGRARDGTGIVTAEDPVAVAGYQAISPVTKGVWEESQKASGEAPEAAEFV